MKGVNKAILVGTVGKDPETKTFQNGGMLTQFSIATNESWTDKNTGEKKQTTEWHRIVINGKLAEIAQKYVKQGMKLYIEGSIKTRQWTDQNGQERYITEIQCQNMQMLDSLNQGQNNQQRQNNQGQQGFQPRQQNARYNQQSAPDDLPY